MKKNGQEYDSVLRVQFSMNQRQLSWLLFHRLLSARKWDFFIYLFIFTGKVLAERNQMRYFFPSPNVNVLHVWGMLSGNRRKLNTGSVGVLAPPTYSGELTDGCS